MMEKFYETLPPELKVLLKDASLENLKDISKAADAMNIARGRVFDMVHHESRHVKQTFSHAFKSSHFRDRSTPGEYRRKYPEGQNRYSSNFRKTVYLRENVYAMRQSRVDQDKLNKMPHKYWQKPSNKYEMYYSKAYTNKKEERYPSQERKSDSRP